MICGEFLQHSLSNCDSELRWKFYNTLLVISTLYCGEFNQGIRSEKIGRVIAVNFLHHTLRNYDGELG